MINSVDIYQIILTSTLMSAISRLGKSVSISHSVCYYRLKVLMRMFWPMSNCTMSTEKSINQFDLIWVLVIMR